MAPNLVATKKYSRLVTITLIVIGLIFLVVAIGFWIALRDPAVQGGFLYAPYYVTLIALLVLIVAWMGHWAAKHQNIKFLYIHLSLIFALCLLQAGIAVSSLIILKSLNVTFGDKITQNFIEYRREYPLMGITNFSCCGDDTNRWPACYFDKFRCYETTFPVVFAYVVVLVVMFIIGMLIEISLLAVVIYSMYKVTRNRPVEGHELE